MPLTDNSVTRHIDAQGTEIKAFLGDDGDYVQAVALVDENGNQIALSGTPMFEIVMDKPIKTKRKKKVIRRKR